MQNTESHRVVSSVKVRSTLLSIVLGLAALSGCVSSGGIDVEGRDTSSFAPGFRFTKEFDDSEGDFRWLGAVEVDTTFLSGESHDVIPAGQSINFHNGPPITGPAAIDTEFDFFQVQFTARGGFKVHEILSMQGLVGVGGTHIRFEAEAATAEGTQRLYSFGPHVGGRIGITPADWLELYGQVRTGGGAGESGYDVELSDFEAGARVTPVEHISFIGGWRWIRYEAEGHGGDSDLEIRLSGPMVMLQIQF